MRSLPAGRLWQWILAAAGLWLIIVAFSPRDGRPDQTASGWQGSTAP
jgi:hypothetical protein